MFPHTLKQSNSKPAAFFLGKSPTHTWQNELRTRLQQFLDEYLQDDNAIHNILGENYQPPKTIPFYFRITKLSGKHHSTSAITIHVGTLHFNDANTLLTKIPFKDITLVPLSMQRTDPQSFMTNNFSYTFASATTVEPSNFALPPLNSAMLLEPRHKMSHT